MDGTKPALPSLASVGSYLDAIAAITEEITLRDRTMLISLDKQVHALWHLGQNVILNWCPEARGISVLVLPHFQIAEMIARAETIGSGTASEHDAMQSFASEAFFRDLLARGRRLTRQQIEKVSRLLGIGITSIDLQEKMSETPGVLEVIENMIRRYGICYVPNRAVALFDIVGFSLLSPLAQMNQLASLAYSLNSAQSKILDPALGINFSRSTTGDGFYIWNRDLSLEANLNLYQLMHLVLADNAIARKKARHATVPRLRASFHIGSCYEFYQSEGLNPTLSEYIVGDVTVDLARIIETALPGQVLVGQFDVALQSTQKSDSGAVRLDSAGFIQAASEQLARLEGLELSGDRINSIKCYLTGPRQPNGHFDIRLIRLSDKHGKSREVYNAKVNIHRHNAEPILLGIEDHVIERQLAGAAMSSLQSAI